MRFNPQDEIVTMTRSYHLQVFLVSLLLFQLSSCLDVTRTRDQPDTFVNSACVASSCVTKRAQAVAGCKCQCSTPFTTFDQVTRKCIDLLPGCMGVVIGNAPNKISYVTLSDSNVFPKTPLYHQDPNNVTTNLARRERCDVSQTTYLLGYSWRTLSKNTGFGLSMEFDNVYLKWKGPTSNQDKIQGNLVKVLLQCRSLTGQATSARCVGLKVGGSTVPGAGNDVKSAPRGDDGGLDPDMQTGIAVGCSLLVVIVVIVITVFAVRECRVRHRRKMMESDRVMIYPRLTPPSAMSIHTKDTTVSSGEVSAQGLVTSTPMTPRLYKKRTESVHDTSPEAPSEHALQSEGGVKRKIRFQGLNNQSFTSLSDTECDKPRPVGILRVPPDFRPENGVQNALVSFEGERIEQPDERAFITRGMWGVQHGFLRDMNRSFRGVEELKRMKTSPPRLNYYSDSELAVPRRKKNHKKSPFKKFINFAISAFGVESEMNTREAKPEYIPTARDVLPPMNRVVTAVIEDEKASTHTHLSDIEYGMFTEVPAQPTHASNGPPSGNQSFASLHPNSPPLPVRPRPTTEGAEPIKQTTPRLGNSPVAPPNGDLYFGKSPRRELPDPPVPGSETTTPSPQEPTFAKELFSNQRNPRRKNSRNHRPTRSNENSHDRKQPRSSPNQKDANRRPSSKRRSSRNKNNNNVTSDYESVYPISSDNNDELDNLSDSSGNDIPISLINDAIAAFPSDTDDEENIPVTNIDECCYDNEIEINPIYSKADINRRISRPQIRTENVFRRDSEASLNQL